jgi:ferric-dicitrate binding protein FerR (iron transport regulator)
MKSAEGGIAYEKAGGAKMEAEKAGLYNTMSTPAGGEYQLTLADGTKVWLNAASSITFPTSFTGKERKVSISGEAYFEVASNPSHPFIVSARGMDVTVLGTHFNINAYADEGSIRTTLLEGSVRVASERDGQAREISPGQQSSLDPAGGMHVREVNTDEVIAWKNGLFQFNKTDIQTMMRQISRWYNIEVKFAGPVNEQFSGIIPRNITLTELLTVLKTVKVKFAIDGNKLTVMSS